MALSPHAARAAKLPASEATPVVKPAAVSTVASSPASSASADAVLLSTARKGTRVLGGDLADTGGIDLERAAVPRPQTPSIWSNATPRRALKDDELFADEVMMPAPGIRAERIAVRAETLLVRPDASRTIDPAAPKVSISPKPAPAVNPHVEARPLPDAGTYANVRHTLPPGALGDD